MRKIIELYRNKVSVRLFVVIALILVLSASVLVYITRDFLNSYEKNLQENNLQRAKMISNQAGYFFSDLTKSIEIIARDRDLNNPEMILLDEQDYNNELSNIFNYYLNDFDFYLDEFDLYELYFYNDFDKGMYFFPDTNISYDYKDSLWYSNLSGLDSSSDLYTIYWSDLDYINIIEDYGFEIAILIENGIIGGLISLDKFADFIQLESFAESGVTYIIDADNNIWSHSEDREDIETNLFATIMRDISGSETEEINDITTETSATPVVNGDEVELITGATEEVDLDFANGTLVHERNDEEKLISYMYNPLIDVIAISEIDLAEAYAERNRIMYNFIFIGILILVFLALTINYMISVNLLIPIKKLKNAMYDIAKGKVNSVKIDLIEKELGKYHIKKKNDEIFVLLSGFHKMYSTLFEIINKMGKYSSHLTKTSKNMKNISEDTNQSIEQTSAALKQIADVNNELASNQDRVNNKTQKLKEEINNLEENNEEIKENNIQVKKVINIGRDEINMMIEQMDTIIQSFDKLNDKIRDLNSLATEIDKITEFINEISEQTNLLALNASIEAARAGTSGSGFGVVAEEIKDLASQTSESAENIGNLIKRMNKNVNLVKKEIDLARAEIEKGSKTSQNNKKAFLKIEKTIAIINDKLSLFNTIIKSISTNSSDLSKNMREIANIGEETSASSEEISASSMEQKETVEMLVNIADEVKNISYDLNDIIYEIKK